VISIIRQNFIINIINIKKHKIVVIGDSHAKGCAAELANIMRKSGEVTGTVIPEQEMKLSRHWLRKKLITWVKKM
jgi:hypothetical protein